MKIDTPTPIQLASIPPLLERRDVIGQAATGSGKTLAFGLPLVQCTKPGQRTPSALVVVPTRELAQQVGAVLSQLIAGTGGRLVVVYGGRAIGPQIAALRKGVQIVVGTPGRLVDLLQRGALRLDHVRYLVLDEADEMLDHGFARDVERLLGATPNERQTALFSATTPEWVHDVSAKYLHDPVVIELGVDEALVPDIDHVVYEVQSDDKYDVLRRLLDEPATGGTLIFARTKHGVRRMGQRLERSGYRLGVLHGNLSQPQRDRVLRDFRSGKMPVLLATNVAARGLDVLHIERVINYDLPETHDLFTHRVGRTGRMGRAGRAITLLGPADLTKWNKIERGLGRTLPRMTLDGEPIATPAPSNGSKNGAKRRRRTSGWRSPQRPRQPQHTGSARAPSQRGPRRARPRLRA
ncbi:MAG: DEAD/DEAH box helicase [Chloroflexi bacterium]|nr:DEAD/DEAH box helicase [Chloroflexota bacterium]